MIDAGPGEEADGPRDPVHRPLVWIFAKWPEPGRSKTRLVPALTPIQAAELAMALLLDRADALRACDSLAWGVAYTPADARRWFEHLLPVARLLSQGEGDLGDRMARVLAASRGQGHRAVMLIGSDLPLLSNSLLVDCGRRLLAGDIDLALAPSPDGGYAMIGLARPIPALFSGIPWSTPAVRPMTLGRAEELRLRVHLTAPVADLDTPEDLAHWIAVRRSDSAVFHSLAPRTAAILQGIDRTRGSPCSPCAPW